MLLCRKENTEDTLKPVTMFVACLAFIGSTLNAGGSVVVTPEPASFALIGLGLVAIGVTAWTKKRK